MNPRLTSLEQWYGKIPGGVGLKVGLDLTAVDLDLSVIADVARIARPSSICYNREVLHFS